MTHGLKITNPSNSLTLDSNAPGYKFSRFITTNDVTTTSTKTLDGNGYGILNDWQLTIEVPSGQNPIFLIQPTADKVTTTPNWYKISNTSVRLRFTCVLYSGFTPGNGPIKLSQSTIAFPTIAMYLPITDNDRTSSYGLNLYNQNSQLSFTTTVKPLFIDSYAICPSASVSYSPSSGWSGNKDNYFYGQSNNWVQFPNTFIAATQAWETFYCYNNLFVYKFLGVYGWNASNGVLKRIPVVTRRDLGSDIFDPVSNDYLLVTVGANKALIVNYI